MFAEQVHTLRRCFEKKGTSGPGNILRQVQSQIGIQQILLDKLNGTVPHCNLIDGTIQIRIG